MTARIVLGVWLAASLVALGCGGGPPAHTPARLGSRSDAIAWFTSQGFTGHESPLNDGTPRWLGNGPQNSVGEVQGPGNTATKVSLIVAASGETGTLTGNFIARYAPGGTTFLNDVI